MKKTILKSVVIGGLLFGLVFYLSQNRQKTFNWDEHYYYKSKDPYGTLFINKLLESYTGDYKLKVLKKGFKTELDTTSNECYFNYVFIGDEYYTSDAESEILLTCIEKGAHALISATEFNLNNWGIFNCYETTTLWDSLAVYNFVDSDSSSDSSCSITYLFDHKATNKDWQFFNIDDTCMVYYDYDALGYETICQRLNFIEIKIGKGSLLLHSTPLLFTNINLQNKRIKEYDEKVLSYLPPGDILWDEYHKIARFNSFQNQKLSGPLQFILSQQSLSWAWYLLLFAVVLYIFFNSKREQRVIPVIQEKQNTSLEFVKTIGKLSQLERNHKSLLTLKMDLFLTFIRDKLNVSTQYADNELFNKIANGANVSSEEVKQLFAEYNILIKMKRIDDRSLLNFNKKLERFYNLLD